MTEPGLVGRSTLEGQRLRMVGFGHGPHPVEAGLTLHLVVYEASRRRHVLCLSEVGEFSVELARSGLGGVVDGELVAPYAVRQLEGFKRSRQLRRMMAKAFPTMAFEWER